MTDDYPEMTCPKCGKETPDMDGFGFIACLPDGCGYCRHVAAEKVGSEWKCSICSAVLNAAEHETRS